MTQPELGSANCDLVGTTSAHHPPTLQPALTRVVPIDSSGPIGRSLQVQFAAHNGRNEEVHLLEHEGCLNIRSID